jgi:hypothetical protein
MGNQNHKTSGTADTVGLSPGFNTEITVKCTTIIQNNIVQWSYGAHTQYCTVELWSTYTVSTYLMEDSSTLSSEQSAKLQANWES